MPEQKQVHNDHEIIRLENITKRFGGVTALENVSFSIAAGEVHAIVGENGAGKSTLMKLLSGVQEQDSGKVFVHGEEVRLDSPIVSEDLGIAMVYQELSLFLPLTVAANIFIGRELSQGPGFLNERDMHQEAASAMDQLRVDIAPSARVATLTQGQRQMVEIARAVSRGTRVVIMDEPNSALNQYETEALFDVIGRLKAQGITVLYVSHRLEEVFTIADRITVLRDGLYMGTWEKDKTSVEEVVSHVVGRRLGEVFPPKAGRTDGREEVLAVKHLILHEGAKPIEFSARRGEVLGFAGLQGAGVEDIFMAIFGLERKKGDWELRFYGEKIEDLSPSNLIEHRWALIPAERRAQGLMLDWPILKNISLVIINKLVSKAKLIRHRQERELTQEYIQKFDIATDSVDRTVNMLSGGNQQKVVVAKWLASEPELLILNDPTRGIDVGTKREIYRLIAEWASQGYTILFTSSEIEEVLGVSDRVLVLYKGEIIREFEADQTDKEQVMRYVLGGEAVQNTAL